MGGTPPKERVAIIPGHGVQEQRPGLSDNPVIGCGPEGKGNKVGKDER
jgi:hypothetical protein